MRSASLFVVAAVLSNAAVAAAGIRVPAPEGNLEPALLAGMQASLEELLRESPAAAGADAELRVSASEEGPDVSLEVSLLPADGTMGIRETRLSSRASALPQVRAMARSVLAAFLQRAPTAPPVEAAPPPPPPEPPEPPAVTPPQPTSAFALVPVEETEDAPPMAAVARDERVRRVARPAIIAGFSLDVAGLLGVVVTHTVVLYGEEFGPGGLAALTASGGTLVLASAVSSSAYTVRHRAYREAGFDTKPAFPVGGWLLSILTTALYATSTIKCAALGIATMDDFWGMIGNAMTFYVAVVTEALNFGLVRTLWRRDLRRSARRSAGAIAVAPLLSASGGGRTARPVVGLALSSSF